MSSISQRTRSKKALRLLPDLDGSIIIGNTSISKERSVEKSKTKDEFIDDCLDKQTQPGITSPCNTDELGPYAVEDDSLPYADDSPYDTGADNFVGSMLYTAFHYPRLFAFMCITGVTALAVAVSNAYPCDHSPPVRCYL